MPGVTDTYVLLRAFCDELARCGIAGACTSPGSRSTPLVLSLVRDRRIPTWSHIDERAAGFFALGVGKAAGRPCAVACTSGTAAANYLPAVVEASEARIPLIVLTADRPPELRDVGAGQAIDQVKLYGDHVRWFVEVGVSEATPATLRWIRQLACRAVWTALEEGGPVHLNFPLREPLVLDADLPDDESGRPDGRPWVFRPPSPGAADPGPLRTVVASAARGVVVCGRSERPLVAAAQFAAAAGWPLLAEPTSGARTGDAAIAHYDALLRDPAFAAGHAPDVVLRVGDLPTSKPLRQWLAAADAVQVAVDPAGAWQDPDATLDLSLALDPAAAFAALAQEADAQPAPSDWLTAWRTADAGAADAIAATLGDALSEPAVAAALVAAAPAGSSILVAASMPIRDVETFAAARDGVRVFANRGANGIDGTLSTAFGIAAATQGPAFVLLGDVTLAHDASALLAATRTRLPLTIVLVDNGGGGIFDFLPVATQRDAFEQHVATPTEIDIPALCRAYGVEHHLVETVEDLRAAIAAPAADGARLLHVVSDRKANVALHRRVWAAVRARGPAAAPGA